MPAPARHPTAAAPRPRVASTRHVARRRRRPSGTASTAGFTRDNIDQQGEDARVGRPAHAADLDLRRARAGRRHEGRAGPVRAGQQRRRTARLAQAAGREPRPRADRPAARCRTCSTSCAAGEPRGPAARSPDQARASTASTTLDALPLSATSGSSSTTASRCVACSRRDSQCRSTRWSSARRRSSLPPASKNVDATFDPADGEAPRAARAAEPRATAPAAWAGSSSCYADFSSDAAQAAGPLRPARCAGARARAARGVAGRARSTIVAPTAQDPRQRRRPPGGQDAAASVDADHASTRRRVARTSTRSSGSAQRPVRAERHDLTGPPELIDAIDKPDFEPKPKARLVITPQDAGERCSTKQGRRVRPARRA